MEPDKKTPEQEPAKQGSTDDKMSQQKPEVQDVIDQTTQDATTTEPQDNDNKPNIIDEADTLSDESSDTSDNSQPNSEEVDKTPLDTTITDDSDQQTADSLRPEEETSPAPEENATEEMPSMSQEQPTEENTKPDSSLNTEPTMPLITPIPQMSEPKPKRKRGIIIMVVIVLLVAVIASGYAAYRYSKTSSKKPAHIKVAVMMAFSGGSSSMGYGANKGVQLAKKQLGIDNIDIVQMDSKCDPKAAVDAMKRLIAQKVAAIIGEGCSSASVAALPLANNSKTVMVSPSASSTTLSIPDDYFFRVVPPDTFQGQYDAQAIYDRGIRTVAVFYTNEPYGSSMNKVFTEKFEGLGGKVVATTSAQPDVIDLNDQMNQLKQANPGAIFFAPNSVVSGTAAMKVGREVGIKAPYFGADILYNTTIIDNAPTAVEGLTISSFPTGTKAFKQALLNEYGVSEQLYAAPQAYDALHAIYLATQKGASTGEEIKNILPTLSFDGVSAHIKFDQNGEISDKNYKYDLLQVKNGAFVSVDQ